MLYYKVDLEEDTGVNVCGDEISFEVSNEATVLLSIKELKALITVIEKNNLVSAKNISIKIGESK
jgi:hypothetical protein